MKILLFDMDGVLLESRGYHMALQETVRYMAQALGFEDQTLTPDDIATFEAGGITKEWDEAVISTALLLEAAWKVDPTRLLPETSIKTTTHSSKIHFYPDFNLLARQLSSSDLHHIPPLERADLHFKKKNHFNKRQHQILHTLITEAHDPERSLPHRTFQELVLGSIEFKRTYGLPAVLAIESYLLKHDVSNLTEIDSARLRAWMSSPKHAATVITSRPSCPPAGVFSTPEAELGAELVGLKDIPIVGWGGITWLARKRHVDQQILVKPSPVHALAALRVSLGDKQENALMEAANLVESGQGDSAWQQLAGAQVSMFEDTPGGIKSLQGAQEVLEKLGIRISTRYFGIAKKQVKRNALLACNAQVFPSLAIALNQSI